MQQPTYGFSKLQIQTIPWTSHVIGRQNVPITSIRTDLLNWWIDFDVSSILLSIWRDPNFSFKRWNIYQIKQKPVFCNQRYFNKQ